MTISVIERPRDINAAQPRVEPKVEVQPTTSQDTVAVEQTPRKTETPLTLGTDSPPSIRKETPINIAVVKKVNPIAKLVVSYSDNADDEVVIQLEPTHFPFMIGRELIAPNHGYEIDEQRGEYTNYASRQHLIIEGYDPIDQAFTVKNPLKRSGHTNTYDLSGRPYGDKFLWQLKTPLCLGHNKGVQIRMEPV